MSVVERGQTEYVSVTLVPESCCNCGVAFAMPDAYRRQKLRDGTWFHCPNGHSQRYKETDVQRLQKQLDAQRAATEAERERAGRLDRQLTAARGQVTKIKNRVANGVCPCCHRTFQNLGRHMGTKHPDYKTQELP